MYESVRHAWRRSLGGLEGWVLKNGCSFSAALPEAERVESFALWVELRGHPLVLLYTVTFGGFRLTGSLHGRIGIPSAF